ncbi:MAG: hypothetical protein JNM00_07115, partial [Flavobacteriales bacterium]|nr:hypothetical protein [Flavobacteriales bacterium]
MKILLSLFAIALLISCHKNAVEEIASDVQGEVLVIKENTISPPQGDPLPKNRVDEIVMGTLEANNDFRWDMVDFTTLWSAVQYGDQTVAIGYRPAGVGDISDIIHQINVRSGAWKSTHDALLNLIQSRLEEMSGRAVNIDSLIVEDDAVLPIISIRLTDKAILTELANLENVRYIEPLDYWPGEEADRSTSGCGASTTTLNSADYTTITPGCKLPWNYSLINVDDAWATAQGSGITIGVIDAGISSTQNLLNSGFNDGDSNVGRMITTSYTYGTSAYT